jgi:Fe-S oxidoreductase
MCKTLDIKMTEIPDWNCCGASVSYAESGELPRIAMNARNFALAETNLPGQDIVATCAACWLGSRESKERLEHNSQPHGRHPARPQGSRPADQGHPRESATWWKCSSRTWATTS